MYLTCYGYLAGIREMIDYCNELPFDSEVLSLQSVNFFVLPLLIMCISLRNVYFVLYVSLR